jgi:hypothetical protein
MVWVPAFQSGDFLLQTRDFRLGGCRSGRRCRTATAQDSEKNASNRQSDASPEQPGEQTGEPSLEGFAKTDGKRDWPQIATRL